MKNKLRCYYCNKLYSTEQKARECENTHDIVFVPIFREDLNRLINFIATGDKNLLSERLSRTLFKYFRSESSK